MKCCTIDHFCLAHKGGLLGECMSVCFGSRMIDWTCILSKGSFSNQSQLAVVQDREGILTCMVQVGLLTLRPDS